MFQTFVEKHLPKNARMVVYRPGHRGMACIRILASHREAYYDQSMCYRSLESPLELSDSVDNSFDNNTFNSYNKVDLNVVWGARLPDSLQQYQYVLKLSKLSKEKLLFVASHDSISYQIPYVYVYISSDEWVRERFQHESMLNTTWRGFPNDNLIDKTHLVNPNCFCIDAYKLLSLDYTVFKQEYARILKHFNFTNNIERVRDFVLTYRNREKISREVTK
jgi:hypothetical protein